MKRWVPIGLVVLAAAAVLTGASLASTTAYWGYNNMTDTNPPASRNECPNQNADGRACSGFNYWDRTQIDYNSGNASIFYSFQNCVGCSFMGYEATYAKTWTLLRTDWNNDHPSGPTVNAYNRVACEHFGGGTSYAYIQCQAVIW